MSEIRVEDGHGGCLTMLDVDGYRYPNFPADIVRNIRHLHVRSDDVIVCAYPKSGTHWVWEIVRQMLALKKTQDGEYELGSVSVKEKDKGFLEMATQEDLDQQPSPRALNTHVHFENLPSKVLTSGCRLVMVVRDPRDVAVSYYHHHSKLTCLYHYQGEWTHYFPLFLDGKLDYGSWFDYHASWQKGLLQHPELNVLALCYEQIQKSPMGALSHLADFLEVPYSKAGLRAVNNACSFDTMRLTKGPLETDDSGSPIMYRKGKTGDWKSTFTREQADLFTAVYKKKISHLKALTYSFDVTPIITPFVAFFDMENK
ncbi:hypothetical protein ACOMHN_003933 [Nucella lapillus]